MKVLVYATLTANGRFAVPDAGPEPSLTPPEVMQDFMSLISEAGTVLMGRATYDDLVAYYGGVDALVRQGVTPYILSKSLDKVEGAVVVATPQQAVREAEDAGHAKLVVSGGAATISSVLQAGLADEYVGNVVAQIGPGLTLDVAPGQAVDLDLVETRQLGAGTVQLRYAVLRAEGRQKR